RDIGYLGRRTAPAAARTWRFAGHSRHWCVRRCHGFQLQSTSPCRRGSGGRGSVDAGPPAPDHRRDAAVGRTMLLALEGLDQRGKETQARHLRARLEQMGRKVHALSFPEYDTPIGQVIARALKGEHDFGADVMQVLYVANRLEYKPRIDQWLTAGDIVI